MSMTMNIHGVKSIDLGDIKTHTLPDGSVFYTRSIMVIDHQGNQVLCLEPFADNGHNLLIKDPVLEEMYQPFVLKAA